MSNIDDRLQFIGLEPAARAVLRKHAPVVMATLPELLDGLYRDVLNAPGIKLPAPADASLAQAKAAQLRHWEILLRAEFDGAFADSAVTTGKAHHRIGLEPRYYIAGCAKILAGLQREIETRMSGWRRQRERRALQDALTRAALLDMELVLTDYVSRSSDGKNHSALQDMCEILEADIDSAVSEVLAISNAAALHGERAAQDAQAIAAEACEVAASSEQATGDVRSVSAATEQLSAAGREIAQRTAQTVEYASRAATEIEQAGSTVAALNDAATSIGEVTNLISEVAAQTNLLALNATIEAARAGEAGKGFAVVAHEVKALSRKTSDAAEDISRRIQDICKASHESIDVINKVGAAVSGIKEVTSAVAAAAEEQEATLRDVARSLTEASHEVAAASQNVTRISSSATEIEELSRKVSELVNGTNGRVSELRANLVVSLRTTSSAENGLQESRRPVSVPASMHCGGKRIEGTILDLSESGLRFRSQESGAGAVEGQQTTVETREFGKVPGKILAVGQTSIHVRFSEMPDERHAAIAAFLHGVDTADRRFVTAARETADRIGRAFEAAIAKGEISEQKMFDSQYRPIPGTNPQQFESASTALCDRILPPIQEPILDLDPRVVFCVSTDSNAFVPTHNKKVSQTPRPNDPIWNAANCRNRRFFKDSAGLRAVRTTREFLLQTYDRDMGGGNVITMKEVDAPIRINGKRWGQVRLGFKV